MNRLYLLFDETCGFCCNCASFIFKQPAYVPVELLAAGGSRARELFPELTGGAKEELVAVDDEGGVYRGDEAWLITLWALRDFRSWSSRMSRGALRPLARNAFQFLSSNRHRVSKVLGMQADAQVARVLIERHGDPSVPKCAGDACEPPKAAASLTVSCSKCRKPVASWREYCPNCLASIAVAPLSHSV